MNLQLCRSGTVVKVAFTAVIELSNASFTVAPMATYTACERDRLSVGSIVITFLLELMVALKLMLPPLELVNFNVVRLSMLLSVNSELSLLRIVSLKVMVMFVVKGTFVAPLAGLKVTVGAVVSIINAISGDISTCD